MKRPTRRRHLRASVELAVEYRTAGGFLVSYSTDLSYFERGGITKGPLTALPTGVAGPNGVYRYGPSGFPTSTFNAANYWVDVVFTPAR